MNIRTYMDIVTELAKSSEHPRYKVAAIVVKKGRIISFACNSSEKTHTLQFKARHKVNKRVENIIMPYVHAEMLAVHRAMKTGVDLSKSTIFVARILRTGGVAISKPCVECRYFIEKIAGIKQMVYYNREGEIINHFLK